MTKTNLGLVTYVKSKLTLPTIYMLGGFGRKLTQAMIDRRLAMGCSHTTRNLTTIKSGIGKYCFDCVGLIKGYLWETSPGIVPYNVPVGSDQNVGMMYRSTKERGPLVTMPDLPGLLVFTADLGHVGVYIGKDANGNRQYVECTPAWGKWGVCQSNDTIRKWAFWGKYHLIDYVTPEATKPSLKFSLGQEVLLTGQVFRNSLLAGPGSSFSGKKVVIDLIVKDKIVPAPYHVSGIGWVKESALSAYIEPPTTIINEGDRVKVIGTNYATGQKIPWWVKLKTHTVADVVVSKARLKEINSWVFLKDIKKV